MVAWKWRHSVLNRRMSAIKRNLVVVFGLRKHGAPCK